MEREPRGVVTETTVSVETTQTAILAGCAAEIRIARGGQEGVGVAIADTWGESRSGDLDVVEESEECGDGTSELVVRA